MFKVWKVLYYGGPGFLLLAFYTFMLNFAKTDLNM